MRVDKSALKHGCSVDDVSHAVDMELYEAVVDEDHDPPTILIIGPDAAGNLLELIGGELEDGDLLIWHADRCRPDYLNRLLQPGGDA